MKEIGAISAEQATRAKATELKITGKPAPNGCTATAIASAGFFCDFLQRWWMNEPAFGANSYERERALKTGGYKIVSSLDVATQNAAKKNVEKYLKTGKKHALMVVSVEPGTGKVRSMAVNRNFKIDDPASPKNGMSTDPAKAARGIRGTYPNTVNPLMSGDQYGYQFGSTFKVFTAVAALENGYPLDYTINSPYQWTSPFITDPGPASCGDKWCPKNASQSMTGVHTMWQAFGRSVNTYFAQLIARVGPDKAVAAAKQLGLTFRGNPNTPGTDAYFAAHPDGWGTFTLGVTQNTPLEMANAFATLAADGTYCEPTPVESITDPAGVELDAAKPRCRKAVDADVARAAIDMARCPLGDRSQLGGCANGGTAPYVHDIVDRPVAGKTGTTDNDRTAAMVATTRQLSVAGIVADPDWTLNNVSDGNLGGKDAHRDVVNPAVADTLRDGMKGKPAQQFLKPDGTKIVHGTKTSIPNVTCKSVSEATNILRDKGFTVTIESSQVNSTCPKGTVAGTSPSGSTSKGSTVSIQISNGLGGGQSPPPTQN
jgi:membrane peptidoglycan carboxypeptidase